MQDLWRILLGVLGLVFLFWVLRWFLGILHLSEKLDRVLEELGEIKRIIREQPSEQRSSPPNEVEPEVAVTPEVQESREPNTCLACGQPIPHEAERCPACGWTWKAVERENT